MMNQQKAVQLEIVPQPEQEGQVEQPTRDWLDLPSEVMANILHRTGIFNILLRVERVCTAWRKICKDPSMWKVINMDASLIPNPNLPLHEMFKHVVDRSQGQLIDFTIVRFGYIDIFLYVADRSSQLKRLTIACTDDYMNGFWTETLKKFPLLEELNLHGTEISREGIEAVSRYCPMLKTLKVNKELKILKMNDEDCGFWNDYSDGEIDAGYNMNDERAMAIGQNLHELRHLVLIGSSMSNEGLKMILDGCHQLELLDLRGCFSIDLHGDLWQRCLQQIKCVKLPYDSLEGCSYIHQYYGMAFDVDDKSEDESEGGSYDESGEGSYDESGGGSDDE